MDPALKARVRDLRKTVKEYVKRHDYRGLSDFLEQVPRLPEPEWVKRKVGEYIRMFQREIEG